MVYGIIPIIIFISRGPVREELIQFLDVGGRPMEVQDGAHPCADAEDHVVPEQVEDVEATDNSNIQDVDEGYSEEDVQNNLR